MNKKRGHPAIRVAVVVAMIGAIVAVVAPQAANATAPSHVTVTWNGCRGDTTDYIATGDPDTPYICGDSSYTGGNLGTGWAELDLVPFRLTTDLGTQASASTSYDLRLTGDYFSGGKGPGYDFITVPIVNTDLSDASCSITASALMGKTAGSTLIYRNIHITQDKGTTCVFDVDYRLAIGATTYPGAALHAHTYNEFGQEAGVGSRDVPINPQNIAPQSISKDMSAQRDVTHTWNVTKGPQDASIDLGDQCAENASAQANVDVTITWTKGAATPSGETHIIANVYATNPAHRDITVSVVDKVYEGSTQTTEIHTGNLGPTNITAGQTVLVGTDEFDTNSTATSFNDVATATYTDTLLGVPVPGNTTATASADVAQGDEANATNTITDTESITGAGLMFSVAAPSVGAFVDAGNGLYVADTETTGPVDWSYEASDSGSVTFHKTVYFDGTGGDASGTLSDTASSDLTEDASLDIDITSSSIATLEIDKTTTVPVDGASTFVFDVLDSTDAVVGTVNVDIAAGRDSGSGTLGGLDDGDYTIVETDSQGFAPAPDKPFTVGAGDCLVKVSIENGFSPATATALKVTDPSGHEAGWDFAVTLDGNAFDSGTTDVNGDVQWTNAGGDTLTLSAEGDYVITETNQTGWTSDDGKGDCSFTVDYPADAGNTYTCTFTNTSRGHVSVTKTENGGTSTDVFTFELRSGVDINDALDPTDDNPGSLLETQNVTADATAVDFTTDLIPGDTYSLCEIVMPGWSTDLPNQYTLVISLSNERVCSDFVAGFGDTTSFTIDNTSPPGGGQRTIGFWKNWASCSASKGHQAFILDQTLALFPIASGQTTHGLYVGTIYVDTCTEAVHILSKQDASGKNQASNAMYGLAAQYLAAVLNIQAGASHCPTVDTAISQAQALLTSYGFNDVKTTKPSKTDAATANALASLLDQYNNGLIC